MVVCCYLNCCKAEDGTDGCQATSGVLAVEDRSLKSSCQNCIVLSVMMLTDPFNQRLVRVILGAASPLKRWHAAQAKQLRSCKSSLQFLKEQVLGKGYLQHCEEMLKFLTSSSAMESCGFVTEAHLKEASNSP